MKYAFSVRTILACAIFVCSAFAATAQQGSVQFGRTLEDLQLHSNLTEQSTLFFQRVVGSQKKDEAQFGKNLEELQLDRNIRKQSALNFQRVLGSQNDEVRYKDIAIIAQAFKQYAAAHNGALQPDNLPEECKVPPMYESGTEQAPPKERITNDPKELCTLSVQSGESEFECAGVDCVYSAHLSPYLSTMPQDPLDDRREGYEDLVDYQVKITAKETLQVTAPKAQLQPIVLEH